MFDIPEHLLSMLAHARHIMLDVFHQSAGIGVGGGESVEARIHPKIVHRLPETDGALSDFFGVSVGISGNIAIVGATQNDDNGSNSGAAYLFDTASARIHSKLVHRMHEPAGGLSDVKNQQLRAFQVTVVVGICVVVRHHRLCHFVDDVRHGNLSEGQ